MGQIFYLLIFGVLLVSTAQAKNIISVDVYGDDAYVPYCFLKHEDYDGIYVRILKKAFSKMDGYRVKIKPVPYKRLLQGLKRGDIFAAFPPYYFPQKRWYIDIYSVPILEEDYSVFCTQKILEKKRLNWPNDYKYLRIGINDGFVIPNAEKLKSVEDAASNEINIKKLLAGNIDCYVNDSLSVVYTAKSMGVSPDRLVKGIKISSEYGHLAFSRFNNPFFKADFIKKFNRVISGMHLSGEIDAIVKSFLEGVKDNAHLKKK